MRRAQYDLYAPAANFAGAVVKAVQLDPSDWSVPHAAVEAAFSERTQLVLINSPHKCAGSLGMSRRMRIRYRVVLLGVRLEVVGKLRKRVSLCRRWQP